MKSFRKSILTIGVVLALILVVIAVIAYSSGGVKIVDRDEVDSSIRKAVANIPDLGVDLDLNQYRLSRTDITRLGGICVFTPHQAGKLERVMVYWSEDSLGNFFIRRLMVDTDLGYKTIWERGAEN